VIHLIVKFFALSNPLWLYWPLVVIIGIVYKTAQYDTPRDIAKGTLHFIGSVSLFMLILAVVLFVATAWFGG